MTRNAMKLAAMTIASLALTASIASAQSNQAITVTRPGSQPSSAGSADNFTGSVRVDSRFQASAPARIGGGIVTFEPGARTAWHTHPLGTAAGRGDIDSLILQGLVRKLVAKGVLSADEVRTILFEAATHLDLLGSEQTPQAARIMVQEDLVPVFLGSD